MSRLHYYAGMVFLVASLFALIGPVVGKSHPPLESLPAPRVPDQVVPATGARAWFQAVKQSCNKVELEILLRDNPAPEGPDRAGFTAACIALSGKIMRARDTVLALPVADRVHAGDIVFEVAEPIAAGDDYAAGEMMALVAEFAPHHYMALYHAGIGAHYYRLDHVTGPYLERFLAVHQQRDRYRSKAEAVLRLLDSSWSMPTVLPEGPP